MTRIRRLPDKIRASLLAEDGLAMVTVIGAMVVSLAFVTAAAVASINTMRGTTRDDDNKSALAAADAGAAAALARQNSVAESGANPCLAPGAGGVLVSTPPETDGWCAPVTGSVDTGSYSYRVAPASNGEVRVVSVGDSDGVNRRIEMTASESTGSTPFAEASLMGLDSLHMDASARAYSNAASNGSISLDSNAQLCGGASVGIGQTLTLTSSAAHGGSGCAEATYPRIEAPLSLPAVQQGNVATENDNSRMFFTGLDTINGKADKVVWDPLARTLELRSNVAITLGGSNYSFCRIKLGSNTTIFIADGAKVRMFFDSPEACGGQTVPLEMESSSQITATSGIATHVAMLFVGSDTTGSTILLNSNTQPNQSCSSDFIIYAPKTDIQLNSNVTYCGAIAGKTLDINSNAVIQTSSQASNFELPGAGPHYVAERFVECTVVSPGAAGEGC